LTFFGDVGGLAEVLGVAGQILVTWLSVVNSRQYLISTLFYKRINKPQPLKPPVEEYSDYSSAQ